MIVKTRKETTGAALNEQCQIIRKHWSKRELRKRRDQAIAMQNQLAMLLRLTRSQLVPVRV